MQSDEAGLRECNIQIGVAETNGDRDWLDTILAPQLAFRRADGITIDDRRAFLNKVKPSDPRETQVESIELCGDRAIVRCIVTVKTADGDKKYHNLRLFVRHQGEWKLLGWANEPL